MHLVHLSKSRASVDLQKRQMERERESEWRRKQRQTAGNRKETGETRRGEGRTDEDGQIRGRKKRREAIRQWEGKLQRRSNTNYKMFISRSLLKHFGTDEFVAKDLKNKREIQWHTEGRRNAAGSFRRARKMFTFDEFDIFFFKSSAAITFQWAFCLNEVLSGAEADKQNSMRTEQYERKNSFIHPDVIKSLGNISPRNKQRTWSAISVRV